MNENDKNIPVIVGQGEISDHPATVQQSLEPLALMVEALQRAEADADASLINAIDSLDIVNLMSWRYSDPATQLSQRLGITPKRAVYGPVGGESPIRYLHEAAQRIARGESVVAAVCGAEAQNSVKKAERAKIDLPWTPFAHDAPPIVRHSTYQHPMAQALNVVRPITIYPFYDAASAAHYGQTPREALAESGALWATYSEEAARNPNAWLKQRYAADAITTPTAENRLIAWPYTKLMVANPAVNQGAALIVTSLSKARELGIADSKLIYFHGGADAAEPMDYLKRDQFYQSHAQNAVLGAAVAIAGGDGRAFDAIELYSCFPCVPKMARRTLGLGPDVKPTVTGGLTFFGAPLNDYMTHAACAMVRSLRDGKQLGLLYGQGGYVTKHHALVLSPNAPAHALAQDTNVQAETDRNRGPVPEMNPDASGDGTVESFTVIYGRNGEVEHGVAILRDRDDRRTLGRITADDRDTLAHLTNAYQSPVGSRGRISRADDGLLNWRIS